MRRASCGWKREMRRRSRVVERVARRKAKLGVVLDGWVRGDEGVGDLQEDGDEGVVDLRVIANVENGEKN